MKNAYRTLAGVFLMGLATTASAVSVDFDLLEARWQNVSGGSNIVYDPASGTYGDPASVNWGVAAEDDVSGYTFDARNTPFTETNPGDLFGLGLFTHDNFPIIAGGGIDSADLQLIMDITIIDDDLNEFVFTNVVFDYRFNHDETDNGAQPCPYGGDNGQGVNINGCADSVTVLLLDSSQTIPYGDDEFVLEISGFATSLEDAIAGVYVDNFVTTENQANNAILVAAFRAVENNVPVPAPIALLGLGLIGLAGTRKIVG